MRRARRAYQLNSRHRLAKDVLSCWPMVERGYQAQDIGPLRNHGTFATTGGVPLWDWVRDGPAAKFDPGTSPNGMAIGASNRVIPFTPTRGLTIVCRVKFAQTNSSRAILKFGGSSGSILALWTGTTVDRFGIRYRNGANTLTTLLSSRTIAVGNDLWCAGVWQDGLGEIWVDGMLEGASTDVSAANTFAFDATVAYIGTSTSTVNIHSGNIGMVTIFGRRLMPAELRELFRAPEALIIEARAPRLARVPAAGGGGVPGIGEGKMTLMGV